VVRDGSLGESLPGKAQETSMELCSYFKETAPAELSIRRVDKSGVKILWSTRILEQMSRDNDMDFPAIIERLERLAREELPKVLTGLGVVEKPTAAANDGPLSADVEKQLDSLNFIEQFLATRAAHAEIREKGESPRRLGGLIRGYANLGLLTEFHWNAAHKALRARAVLEAQRWIAREPKSAEALFHRAYAWTLAGFHKLALDDLAQANKRAPESAERPDWARLIEASCRFDTKKLLSEKKGPRGQLAMLLAFLSVEHVSGNARALSVGRAVVDDNPENYRVHDALCELGGVSNGHVVTVAGMQVLAEQLPTRLTAAAGLPEKVRDLVRQSASEQAIATALIDEGRENDRSDLSWEALGRMIRDVRFVQVWRRAYFLRVWLGVPLDEFINEVRPMIADHPYRSLIQAMGLDPVRQRDRYFQLIDDVKIPDLDFNELQYIYMIAWSDVNRSQPYYWTGIAHGDSNYHDSARLQHHLAARSGPTIEPVKKLVAHICEDISPFSPLARVALIDDDWDYVKPHAAEWEATSKDQAVVQLGFARKYQQLEKWDDAKRCYEQSVSVSPDMDTYRAFAEMYRAQGKVDEWKKTLERYLAEGDDPGLDSALIQVELANHLMDLKRWNEAKPYAETAAQTGAGWAMNCVQRCYEGLEDWQNAERWAAQSSDRYPDQEWQTWFLFCKRTGKGDVASALAVVDQYIDSHRQVATGSDKITFGLCRFLAGEPKEALEILQSVNEPGEELTAWGFIAEIADDLGDAKLRDANWRRFLADPRSKERQGTKLYRKFVDVLERGEKGKLDLAQIDDEIAKMPETVHPSALLTVGWFLANHGTAEDSQRYLSRALSARSFGPVNTWHQALAFQTRQRLKDRKPPEDKKPAEKKD
jgi:tetratricopeptide (TPR) repeat protein